MPVTVTSPTWKDNCSATKVKGTGADILRAAIRRPAARFTWKETGSWRGARLLMAVGTIQRSKILTAAVATSRMRTVIFAATAEETAIGMETTTKLYKSNFHKRGADPIPPLFTFVSWETH